MVINRILDEAFRSWSHVAVLRTLLDTTTGFTGNHVARLAGMHPRSALKALSSLELLGIVRRQRGGRDHIFTLNRNHFFVKEAIIDLYERERRFPLAIAEAISIPLRQKVLSAVIFGSVAKKQETPESDLDLCCVVKSEAEKEKARTALQSESASLHEQFGVKLAPLFFTIEELRKKSSSPLVRDLLANGILVLGQPLKALLNGKTPAPKTR